MFERLWRGVASGACLDWVFVVPGGMCGQVAFTGSHLVYAACNELIETHEGVGGVSRRIGVILSGGEVFGPSIQERLSGSSPEGRVGLGHQGGGGYVGAGRSRGFENEGEAGKTLFEGDRESSKGIEREVFSERRGGDRGPPVQREVD